jgi:hypothetical protein
MKKFLSITAIMALCAVMAWMSLNPQVGSAQVYADKGVSNYPGGGWVFGSVQTIRTNSGTTNFIVSSSPVPLGFFGAHSTNQATVPIITNYATATAENLSNQVAQINVLVRALYGYGLIKTN